VPTTEPYPIAAALADRYIVERELGRGGMATVYLAEEKKHGRTVAIKVLRQELTAAAYTRATLGWVLARGGQRAEAERLLGELDAAAREGYVSPAALAILHIGLGNLDRALELAERAYGERRGWLVYFKVNPMLDPLRREPRFAALLATMRL
jgi:serine/threonine protein kinase